MTNIQIHTTNIRIHTTNIRIHRLTYGYIRIHMSNTNVFLIKEALIIISLASIFHVMSANTYLVQFEGGVHQPLKVFVKFRHSKINSYGVQNP